MADKILLVDDEADFLKLAKQNLEMMGTYQIDTALSVDEATKKHEKKRFDVIVADYEMPGKNGLEFLKELRDGGDDTPFIIFTGKGREEIAINALNLGADHYIRKIGDTESMYEELKHAIRRSVKIKRAEEALRESEDKYRDLFENANDMIQCVDKKGEFVYVNRKWLEELGYMKEEMQKLKFTDVLRIDQIPHCMELFEKVCSGEAFENVETVFLAKDGGEVFVEGNINANFRDGKFFATRGIFRNITEQKKVEKMKERFISTITHELRTPLVSIKGYLVYILSGKFGQVPEKIESSLEVVKRNTDRLHDLVNDLLDMRRIESGKFKLNLRSVDIHNVISECWSEIRPMVEDKDQKFIIKIPERPLWTNGDFIRLCQVVMNLLSNANKFTPEGGEITLRVEEEDNAIRVQVSDTGIGIKKDDLKSIFEAFAEIEKPAHTKDTGLGLNVTKGLIEAHGGIIWAESSGKGKGATFYFTLPIKTE